MTGTQALGGVDDYSTVTRQSSFRVAIISILISRSSEQLIIHSCHARPASETFTSTVHPLRRIVEEFAHMVAMTTACLDDRKHCARGTVGTFKRVGQQCFSMRRLLNEYLFMHITLHTHVLL